MLYCPDPLHLRYDVTLGCCCVQMGLQVGFSECMYDVSKLRFQQCKPYVMHAHKAMDVPLAVGIFI